MSTCYDFEKFHSIADQLARLLGQSETFNLWLAAETTDFVRFNRGQIRQAGEVRQAYASFELISENRRAQRVLAFSGDPMHDLNLLKTAILSLREALTDLPHDPHLLLPDQVQDSQNSHVSMLTEGESIVADILPLIAGLDLVGILASGPMCFGFANSRGQRNFQQTTSYNFDFSVHLAGDKAIKRSLSGFSWQRAHLAQALSEIREQLKSLGEPARRIPPGSYRAYLAPAAVAELFALLNWEGFSERALRGKRSALLALHGKETRLADGITLSENIAEGLAPAFQASGFIKPGRVPLIERGKWAGSLISPRTAREYGIAHNGADDSEIASSFDLSAGDLPHSEVLSQLGEGLYISNLWYLNFSDRKSCRITGMTRFASFWVQDGKWAAPLEVMRFDDSLYRILGDHLLALTREREFIVDAGSYGARSAASVRVPGALLSAFNLVL